MLCEDSNRYPVRIINHVATMAGLRTSPWRASDSALPNSNRHRTDVAVGDLDDPMHWLVEPNPGARHS
jgi:hypothetical protein